MIDRNFHTLSIMLNELNGPKPDSKNVCRKKAHLKGMHYFFFKYLNEKDERSYFIINYDTSNSVKFSKFFVNPFHGEKVKENWIKKSLRIEMASNALHVLLVNPPLMLYSQSGFSDLLRHFISLFIGTAELASQLAIKII